jgi:hypothetical protein
MVADNPGTAVLNATAIWLRSHHMQGEQALQRAFLLRQLYDFIHEIIPSCNIPNS